MKKKPGLLWVAILAVLVGMGAGYYFVYGDKDADSASEGHTAAVEQTASEGVEGKVVEVLESGGYTYVQVESGGRKIWAASPQCSVKLGDEAVIPDGMLMNNFQSKILNRSFETIYLVSSISKKGDPPPQPPQPAAEGHGTMGAMGGGSMMGGAMGAAKPPASVDLSGIKKAEGGKTIAEIYAGKADLTGKEVVLRGKVVKYNPQIMGKNWMHVQDGTGEPGSNDLTVTTSATAGIGDTVLIKGVLHADKDIGSGYKYDLIVEDATVTVEK